MKKYLFSLIVLFLFIEGNGQSDKPKIDTSNHKGILISEPPQVNVYGWDGVRGNAGLPLSNTFKVKSLAYVIADSSGSVAKQDAETGRWEIKDADRALTVMVDTFIRETTRLNNELELADNIIKQLRTDGTIKNWRLYQKAVKEYQDYHLQKQPLKIYSTK